MIYTIYIYILPTEHLPSDSGVPSCRAVKASKRTTVLPVPDHRKRKIVEALHVSRVTIPTVAILAQAVWGLALRGPT